MTPNLYSLIASITRLYPFYSGNAKLANNAIVRRIAGSHAKTWAKTPGGEVQIFLDEYVGRTVYFTGDLDRKISWVCSRIVRPGDTVIDIGANIGVVSLLLSSLVGKTGKVHSFEPNPQLHEMFENTMRRNSATNVTLHRVALGAGRSTLSLSYPLDNFGGGSLIARQVLANTKTVDVPVVPLSDALRDEDLSSLKLIKIDVEGFEPEVLRGASDILDKVRPNAILFELNDPPPDFSKHPTIELLSRLDYAFFSIPRSFLKTRILRVGQTSQSNAIHTNYNFLASPKGKVYESIASLLNAS